MSLTFTAKVNKLQNPSGSLRAFATLIINDVVAINGFRVLEGRNGAWAAAPQTKGNKPNPETGKDQYWDDVRFLENKEEGAFKGPVAKMAMAAIMKEYNEADTGASDQRPEPNGGRPARTKRW